jgi:hypothetical protein
MMDLKRLFNKHLIKRSIVFWWQRQTRGWDDSETWSMDYSLSKIIVQKLRVFQEINHRNPVQPFGMTTKEWEDKISEMIWGFQWFADGKQYTYTYNSSTNDGQKPFRSVQNVDEASRAHDAVELFAFHYKHLWIPIPTVWGSTSHIVTKHHLAEIILPRLQRFKEVCIGHPHNMRAEEWNRILTEMIWGFQWHVNNKFSFNSQEDPNYIRANEAIELFGFYYGHLWW